jgi:hypothetical protein
MSDDVRSLGALAGFVDDLQRRHVFRVAIVYCAVGWAIAEVSATFLPALGVPDWSVSLVAVLLVLAAPPRSTSTSATASPKSSPTRSPVLMAWMWCRARPRSRSTPSVSTHTASARAWL